MAKRQKSATSLKPAALGFLRLVAAGNAREAYRRYVAPDFRHLKPFFRGDQESLMLGMEENAARNPNMDLEIQWALQDGDLIAVHSRVRPNPDEPGMAVVHIFRFEGNLIAELWDVGQAVPADSPNEHGMF